MQPFFDTTIFALSFAWIFLLPGFLTVSLIWPRASRLEKFFFAFPTGLALVNFLILLLGSTPIKLAFWPLNLGLLFFSGTLGFLLWRRHQKNPTPPEQDFFQLPRERWLFIALLLLTILIKSAYLENSALPTSTDLGHHSYWAKLIQTTSQLPVYAKSEIDLQTLQLGTPEPIADFIIGEHLPLAALAIVSGLDFISPFPMTLLFIFHVVSLVMIFFLTAQIFAGKKYATQAALLALFLVGPLWALASPQAKFISGGVIGNALGNLLLPTAFYFYAAALEKFNPHKLAIAFFFTFALAYTHHLSSFIFLFTILFFVPTFALLKFKSLSQDLGKLAKMLFSFWPLLILILGFCLVFFVHTPTYLNPGAVNTAVGTPSKETRMGLTFAQLTQSSGEARMALGLGGLLILALGFFRLELASGLLFAWSGALLVMSLKPQLLFVDIPSNRISSYLVFPLAILAAYLLLEFSRRIKSEGAFHLKQNLLAIIFLFLAGFAAFSGMYDNAQTTPDVTKASLAQETYQASKYLAKNSTEQEMILKDHNYLKGDSWIKLYFMRGYNYPLSRAYFKRYEDPTKPREMCTNEMISAPDSEFAQKCFTGTNTKFLLVNPTYDSRQFEQNRQFWKIYTSANTASFYRP